MSWPTSFERIPDAEWTRLEIAELAKKYDTVENHGWYRNLDPTVDALAAELAGPGLHVDYSAGTAIFLDRIRAAHPNLPLSTVLVDGSPKFLRLALEKYKADARVAFRLLPYVKDEKRLRRLDEVLPVDLHGQVDLVTSTNAIHLYYAMDQTLSSWRRCLRPGGVVLVQSGNIDNPAAAGDAWIIDRTVEELQPHARSLVESDAQYAVFRDALHDDARMAKYDQLRRKYFLPVRPLEFYVQKLCDAGFEVTSAEAKSIEASTEEWFEFLAAYHEGVLGWAGGAPKVSGEQPSDELLGLRRSLLRDALYALMRGQPSFIANWTYIRAVTTDH